MSQTPIWKTIALALTADIAEGRFATGDRLPTEAQLAATHGVNRHTVRRAVAELAKQGLVHPRRGAGVFVSAAATDYPIGKRVRYHQNISASGIFAHMPLRMVVCVVFRFTVFGCLRLVWSVLVVW